MEIQPSPTRREAAGLAVKIGASRQVAIPKTFYDRLRLAPGDYLEVNLQEEHLVLTPKTLVEKRLAEGLADIKAGRVHGPFSSVTAMLRSLHGTRTVKRSKKSKTR